MFRKNALEKRIAALEAKVEELGHRTLTYTNSAHWPPEKIPTNTVLRLILSHLGLNLRLQCREETVVLEPKQTANPVEPTA